MERWKELHGKDAGKKASNDAQKLNRSASETVSIEKIS
jgi:hypothetical protein